jgi:hypothetical protein
MRPGQSILGQPLMIASKYLIKRKTKTRLVSNAGQHLTGTYRLIKYQSSWYQCGPVRYSDLSTSLP